MKFLQFMSPAASRCLAEVSEKQCANSVEFYEFLRCVGGEIQPEGENTDKGEKILKELVNKHLSKVK